MGKKASHRQTHFWLKSYVIAHLRSGFSSLGRLATTPFSSFITCLVIAIALALPLAMLVGLNNLQAVSQGWDQGARISLFLKTDVSESNAQDLIRELRLRKDIGQVTYVSPQEGLKEFEQQSGFGDVLSELSENPLPAVIEVQPALASNTPSDIKHLYESLKSIPQVDIAKVDLEWVNRLYAMLDLARTAIYILGVLLCLGVFLSISNTIRLTIQNHHEEIEIIKLVGATNAFIRRPFLYTGVLYGFFGALLAVLLVNICLFLLNTPIEHLAELYNSHFSLNGLSLGRILGLFLLSSLLGLVAAWIVVNRHLRAVAPQ